MLRKLVPLTALVLLVSFGTGVNRSSGSAGYDYPVAFRVVVNGPGSVTAGLPAVWRIRVTNTGKVALTSVKVQYYLAHGAKVMVSSTQPFGVRKVDYLHDAALWPLGRIAVGQSRVVRVVSSPPSRQMWQLNTYCPVVSFWANGKMLSNATNYKCAAYNVP